MEEAPATAVARLARRLYAYAFLEDLILLYPVYALLFAEHGLSAAEISSLFIIWSCVTFVVEIPSGLWADLFSRRRLLTLAPLVTGAGYAMWTWLPSYPAFAAGFVLWGAGSSLRSGTLQALVYEELERQEAAGSYARFMGRSQAMGTTAMMAATALAGPVMHLGGYAAVGAASVAVCLLGALVGRGFPESRAKSGSSERGSSEAVSSERGSAEPGRTEPGSAVPKGSEAGTPQRGLVPGPALAPAPAPGTDPAPTPGTDPVAEPRAEPSPSDHEPDADDPGFLQVLRTGLGELRASRPARDAVLLTSAVTGALMIDEYVPLLIRSMDVSASAVPLLMLLVTVGVAARRLVRGARRPVARARAGRGGARARGRRAERPHGCGAAGARVRHLPVGDGHLRRDASGPGHRPCPRHGQFGRRIRGRGDLGAGVCGIRPGLRAVDAQHALRPRGRPLRADRARAAVGRARTAGEGRRVRTAARSRSIVSDFREWRARRRRTLGA
ncbi:MFS transporter [Streptomyces marispadix]|uniref:MFS transporter n=1 Tax=Streptomyces marispadix TaxID=2922868 RepID=A0ABS9T3Z0_9ACTN|nr:MFS transporter [Streptomyces marispadix]MCH6163256.1 MFS transporter [Streptomyces marispadix]